MKKYIITVNGTKYEVAVEEADPNATYVPAETKKEEPKSAPAVKAEPAAAPVQKSAPAASADGAKVNAPLPGNILKVNFSVGDTCKKGDVLCILEAMKMENEVIAPCDGKIASAVSKGATVNTGDQLFVIA
ncbi:MAG: acetyl-CoA carboxylase biotin carboxyl carrier protein subunit [Eubacteriales bacterium]|nr:acetyl-CoA carboxylase biotin carboxyl carrier protein subunit [Eubacteriales bacterium]